MKTIVSLSLLSLILTPTLSLAANTSPTSPKIAVGSIYEIKLTDIDGNPTNLKKYQGQAILIVNTASNCGYTPQYDGLEALYQQYKGKGFVVVGFPSNDFGGQEPGTEKEIKKFCDSKVGKYKVTFPLMAKSVVTGSEKSPLFQMLTSGQNLGGEVSWNFEKFLVDKRGQVVERFKSKVIPESDEIKKAIEKVL